MLPQVAPGCQWTVLPHGGCKGKQKPAFQLNLGRRWNYMDKCLVPLEGLEPPLLSEADFESAASTIPPQGHFQEAFSSACFAKVEATFAKKTRAR